MWSDRPFGATISAADVADRGAVLHQNGGEASVIYEIESYPGWLAKHYQSAMPADHSAALDQLIALPGTWTSQEDQQLVDRAVAWPVSRIVSGSATIGVVIGKAPQEFFADLTVLPGRVRRCPVVVDHLVLPAERCAKLGLPFPSVRERLLLIRAIVIVGDLFQRCGLVYGDWSYANTFWAPRTDRILVIDADSCAFARRPFVASPSWDDPLVTAGGTLTSYTDRYKLAVLALRCLTGVRTGDAAALAALPASLRGSTLEEVLRRAIQAATATARPSLPELLNALGQAAQTDPDGVTWRFVSRPGRAGTVPAPTTAYIPASPAGVGPAGPAASAPSPPSGPSAVAGGNVAGWRELRSPGQPGQPPGPGAAPPSQAMQPEPGPAALSRLPESVAAPALAPAAPAPAAPAPPAPARPGPARRLTPLQWTAVAVACFAALILLLAVLGQAL